MKEKKSPTILCHGKVGCIWRKEVTKKDVVENILCIVWKE